MGRRIHLVRSGGGVACGAHSVGLAASERGEQHRRTNGALLASPLLALVDCFACRRTDLYRNILNPPRQYQMRLFTVRNTPPPARLSPIDISADPVFHRVEVLLDGAPQLDFVSYDVQGGWVERYLREDGRCVPARRGGFATERVAGAVTVRWRQAA